MDLQELTALRLCAPEISHIGSRPIANKYHEGKVKRTLKRELKVPEIAERKANGTSLLGEIVAGFRP